MKIATSISAVRERAQQPAPPVTVDADARIRILRIAVNLTPYADRPAAEAVKATAAPLLEWAASASDRQDVRLRVLAMEQQDANTPVTERRLPRTNTRPFMIITEPAVTTAEFLTEAAALHAFYRGE
jgi:hypothetical protein